MTTTTTDDRKISVDTVYSEKRPRFEAAIWRQTDEPRVRGDAVQYRCRNLTTKEWGELWIDLTDLPQFAAMVNRTLEFKKEVLG